MRKLKVYIVNYKKSAIKYNRFKQICKNSNKTNKDSYNIDNKMNLMKI